MVLGLNACRDSDVTLGKRHAAAHAGEGSVADFASHKNLVDLVLGMARVHEALGKLAHVGEKDEALGVVVEAAYRKEAQVAVPLRHKVKDSPAALGISGSGDYLHGLVQHEDNPFLFGSEFFAVHANRVCGLYSISCLGRMAVYGDTPLGNELVRFSARAKTSACQVFVETYAVLTGFSLV